MPRPGPADARLGRGSRVRDLWPAGTPTQVSVCGLKTSPEAFSRRATGPACPATENRCAGPGGGLARGSRGRHSVREQGPPRTRLRLLGAGATAGPGPTHADLRLGRSCRVRSRPPAPVLAGSHMPETSSEIHCVPFPPAALPTPDMRTQTVGAALWPRHVLAWGPRGVSQSPPETHLSRTPPHAPEGGHPDPQEGASEGEDVDIHLEERKRRQGFNDSRCHHPVSPPHTHTQVWKMSPDPGRCHDHAVPSGKKAASEKA